MFKKFIIFFSLYFWQMKNSCNTSMLVKGGLGCTKISWEDITGVFNNSILTLLILTLKWRQTVFMSYVRMLVPE